MRVLAALGVLLWAAPASAELLFFAQGRTMSVVSHRRDGDRIIAVLRGGGEMAFSTSLVERIEPDEVPWPDKAPWNDAQAGRGAPRAVALIDTPFDPLIRAASVRHGIDTQLLKAVIQVESAYLPRARSPKGAMGLMQLMPATAREYRTSNPYDPASNIDAGTRHLKRLLGEFELPLALAAYNAGEAAVRRFGGIPPYAETRAYVAKILALVGMPHR